MTGWGEDKAWSDRFIPAIKSIVGPFLLVETPHEIDCTQAADLMVFTARNMRIAARVRRPGKGYAERYRYEFTIRCHRDTGTETELSKIVNGWADWMFYGHSNKDETGLGLWWLLDLDAFRAGLIRESMNDGYRLIHGQRSNGDGTEFKFFDIRSFPDHPPLVIGSNIKAIEGVEAQLEIKF